MNWGTLIFWFGIGRALFHAWTWVLTGENTSASLDIDILIMAVGIGIYSIESKLKGIKDALAKG